ncbi:MAG: hypothetical protein AB7F66_12305 [Bacteriovoracia bacterium]
MANTNDIFLEKLRSKNRDIPTYELDRTIPYGNRSIELKTSHLDFEYKSYSLQFSRKRVVSYLGHPRFYVDETLPLPNAPLYRTEAEANLSLRDLHPRSVPEGYALEVYRLPTPQKTAVYRQYLNQEEVLPCATKQWKVVEAALSDIKSMPRQQALLFDTMAIEKIEVTVVDERNVDPRSRLKPRPSLVTDMLRTLHFSPYLNEDGCAVVSKEDLLTFLIQEEAELCNPNDSLLGTLDCLRNIEDMLGESRSLKPRVADQQTKAGSSEPSDGDDRARRSSKPNPRFKQAASAD